MTSESVVDHPPSHDIGTRLYQARVAAGLSRAELARRAGVSAYSVGDIECDRKCTYPSWLTLAGRGADGGLRLRAPPLMAESCRRFGHPIVRALFEAGDPGAQRVVIVDARSTAGGE